MKKFYTVHSLYKFIICSFAVMFLMLLNCSISVYAGGPSTIEDQRVVNDFGAGTTWTRPDGYNFFTLYIESDTPTNEYYNGRYYKWYGEDEFKYNIPKRAGSDPHVDANGNRDRADIAWFYNGSFQSYRYSRRFRINSQGKQDYYHYWNSSGWQEPSTTPNATHSRSYRFELSRTGSIGDNLYVPRYAWTFHDPAAWGEENGGLNGHWTVANRQYIILYDIEHTTNGYELAGSKVTHGQMTNTLQLPGERYAIKVEIDTNDVGITEWAKEELYPNGECHSEVNIYLKKANNTITFNTNNPESTSSVNVTSGSLNPITVRTGSTWGSAGTFPTVSKTNYNFLGWYTSRTGGTQITANSYAYNNLTVYARWSPKAYTLTYDKNNPSSDNDVTLSKTSQTGYYNSAWGTLATISKPGYTFNGWYTAKTGGTQVTNTTVCKGNLTVYARWTPNTYTLTYNKNNPNTSNDINLSKTSQTTKYNTAWGTLATASKTGYTFVGWFTAPSGGSQISASNICKGNLTVYAHWTPNTYTLTYDPNHPNDAATDSSDMTVSKTSQTAKFDSKWGALATASKPGCQFLGWYTAKTGGTQVTADTICKGNLTVYGRWKVLIYTLTYDKNNPSSVSDASNIQLSKPNNQVKYSQPWGELATASKRGYTFLGWFTAKTAGREILATDVNNADLTAYAHWEPNPYTMTYHKNNPPTARTDETNIELSKESQTVLFDQPWGELATASKRGYTFLGWFTKPVGGTQVTKDTLVDDDIDVYAHWTPIIYTLTYDKNNPPTARTDASNIILSKPSQQAPFDDVWGPLATASKTGYTFLGWFTDPEEGEQVTRDTVVDGDLTVYAHWRVNQYIIRFHPNTEHAGDTPIVTGDMPSITVKYDERRNLPANTFTKTTLIPAEDEGGETLRLSSVFKGWSTNKASLIPALLDEAEVLNWSSTDGDIIDLYAIWDDAPKFNVVEYPDRYFTLEEAQNGTITEDELLKTVTVYDRETNPLPPKPSGTPGPGVSVVGYDPEEFTNLTDDSSILVRYKVEDDSGNKAYLNIIVYVSRNAHFDTSKTPYLRSISSLYSDKDAVLGGLSEGSQWRNDPTYAEALQRAMDSNVSLYDVHLNKAQLKAIRDYVETNGLGNSENPDALREFRNYINY